jgi:hypothetical protein
MFHGRQANEAIEQLGYTSATYTLPFVHLSSLIPRSHYQQHGVSSHTRCIQDRNNKALDNAKELESEKSLDMKWIDEAFENAQYAGE